MPRGGRLIACGVIGAVPAVGGAAEAVVRHRTADRLADRLDGRLHTGLQVGFGPTPVLPRMARGSFSRVEVTGRDATFRRFTGVDLRAERDQVVGSGSGLRVRDSRVRAEMSDDAPAGAVATMTGSGRPAAVTTDPASSEVVVRMGFAGLLKSGSGRCPTTRGSGSSPP